jgi:hypothetical protein
MAKITRSSSKAALVEGEPHFHIGADRISIGITSRETGQTWHLHLNRSEARKFAEFMRNDALLSAS